MLDKEHQEEDEDLDFRALENGFVSLAFLYFLVNWYCYVDYDMDCLFCVGWES